MGTRIKGDLTVTWNKTTGHFDEKTGRVGDVIFNSTDGPHAVDGRRLLYHAFSVVKMGDRPEDKSFLDELEARGFDLETIRFSINRKKGATSS